MNSKQSSQDGTMKMGLLKHIVNTLQVEEGAACSTPSKLSSKSSSSTKEKKKQLSDKEYALRKATFQAFCIDQEYEQSLAEIMKSMSLGQKQIDSQRGKLFVSKLWGDRFYNSIVNHAQMDGRESYMRNQKNNKILDDYKNKRITINKNFMPVPMEDELYQQAYQRIEDINDNLLKTRLKRCQSQQNFRNKKETSTDNNSKNNLFKLKKDNYNNTQQSSTGIGFYSEENEDLFQNNSNNNNNKQKLYVKECKANEMINDMTERSSYVLYKPSEDNKMLRDIEETIQRIDRQMNVVHTEENTYQTDDYFQKSDFKQSLLKMKREITHRRDLLERKPNMHRSVSHLNNLIRPRSRCDSVHRIQEPARELVERRQEKQVFTPQKEKETSLQNSTALKSNMLGSSDKKRIRVFSTFLSNNNTNNNFDSYQQKYDRLLDEQQKREETIKEINHFNSDLNDSNYQQNRYRRRGSQLYQDPEEIEMRKIQFQEWIQQNQPSQIQPGQLGKIISLYQPFVIEFNQKLEESQFQNQEILSNTESKDHYQENYDTDRQFLTQPPESFIQINQFNSGQVNYHNNIHIKNGENLMKENSQSGIESNKNLTVQEQQKDTEMTHEIVKLSVNKIAEVINQLHIENIDDINQIKIIQRAQSDQKGYKILIGKPERKTLRDIDQFIKQVEEKYVITRPVIQKGEN